LVLLDSAGNIRPKYPVCGLWGTRVWLTREAPIFFGIFADFGLEVHVKKAGQTAPSKSVVLFYSKRAR
jgi:hypothetical protein